MASVYLVLDAVLYAKLKSSARVWAHYTAPRLSEAHVKFARTLATGQPAFCYFSVLPSAFLVGARSFVV